MDIKLLTDYDVERTTHVVSRKRNTAKGLQALINSKYVITESFLDAVAHATENVDDSSLLEQDFTKNWPDAMAHLPPRGGEPVQHPDAIYAPDSERGDVFDGYTFIFYDKTQYDNLMAPIMNGSGKATLQTVTPDETEVDDFVRYVKEVAGEKGLGSFEDGSEGKGVVLVRYLPAKGDHIAWYAEFITAVSLRLDHRPIEQNEFLEAILTKDASQLRRPLEVEPSPADPNGHKHSLSSDRVSPQAADDPVAATNSEVVAEQPSPLKRRGARRPLKRRFAGFDDDADITMNDSSLVDGSAPSRLQAEEEGLFVSQEQDILASQPAPSTQDGSPRKRAASPADDLMDGMAPAVARFKRQRLERGDAFASRSPEPERTAPKAPARKKKEKMDVLALAARNREEEEARARAEREDLANLPDDIDLAEIRRLNIVEEIEVCVPDRDSRTREQDISGRRWNPKWNGVKNFKKFRRRGETTGRQAARTIVALAEVKNKEFGIGDNYWLEDESSGRKKSSASHPSLLEPHDSAPVEILPRKRATHVVVSESEAEADNNDSVAAPKPSGPSGTGSTKITATPSQDDSIVSSIRQARATQEKRPAGDSMSNQRAKRPRPTPRAIEVADSDDSEDELKFRFGRRR